MNDSNLSNLSIQGQGMNLENVNTPNRPQWGNGPRGTIINVLERANVYDHTMTSTMNTTTSDISLKASANRVNPDRKNETYLVSSPKSVASSNSTVQKPIENNLNQTLTSKSKQDKNKMTTTLDKDELVECLTTGRFDAKNRQVIKIDVLKIAPKLTILMT